MCLVLTIDLHKLQACNEVKWRHRKQSKTKKSRKRARRTPLKNHQGLIQERSRQACRRSKCIYSDEAKDPSISSLPPWADGTKISLRFEIFSTNTVSNQFLHSIVNLVGVFRSDSIREMEGLYFLTKMDLLSLLMENQR